mgnify:CR=1 FL=1
MTTPNPTVFPRPRGARRAGAAMRLVALLACLGAAPAPPAPGTPGGPEAGTAVPPSLDALAGRPSNRFT